MDKPKIKITTIKIKWDLSKFSPPPTTPEGQTYQHNLYTVYYSVDKKPRRINVWATDELDAWQKMTKELQGGDDDQRKT